MQKQMLNKPTNAKKGNDLVYFLASLGIFVIMALLASDSHLFFK